MGLSKSLVSKFVKTTSNNTKNTKKETFLHGYIVLDSNNQICVKVSNYGDGSDSYIPVKLTTNVNVSEPVTVMIKNHTATVIGNATEVGALEDDTTIDDISVVNANTPVISSETIQKLWADYFNEN